MKHIVAALMLCCILAGFAAAAPPSYKDLAKLPVIRFGDTVPDNKDYILLFSAGQTVTDRHFHRREPVRQNGKYRTDGHSGKGYNGIR